MDKVVYRPGISPLELVTPETVKKVTRSLKLSAGGSGSGLRQTPETDTGISRSVPGAKPSDTPAFYNFMNYADLVSGTWHIRGGCLNLWVRWKLWRKPGCQVITSSTRPADLKYQIISNRPERGRAVCALLTVLFRELITTTRNWCCRINSVIILHGIGKPVMAPSALLYYIAFDKKLQNISHHTLFFDYDFEQHAQKIYDEPGWPDDPLFYRKFPFRDWPVDGSGRKRSCGILIPVASGLDIRGSPEEVFQTGYWTNGKAYHQSLNDNILFYKSYGVTDFITDYNGYKGMLTGCQIFYGKRLSWNRKCITGNWGICFIPDNWQCPGRVFLRLLYQVKSQQACRWISS